MTEMCYEKDKEIERLNNTLKEVRTCNVNYYEQISELSSIISLINKFINEEKNLIPLHVKEYINKIITDKPFKLGDYIDESVEI